MNILIRGFRALLFRLKMATVSRKYVREACRYLGIDRKEFLNMAKNSAELKKDFYNTEEAVFYIPRLVYYNRVEHDRDKTWKGVLSIIKRYDNPSVLEFGCGTACLTQYLLEKGAKFKSYAYDIPSKTLEFAKWRLKDRTRFLNRLDDAGSFDIVTVISVLEHIKPEECRKTAEFLEKVTKNILIVNFVSGPGVGHLKETQAILPEIEKFFDNRFKKKNIMWSPDLFAYER